MYLFEAFLIILLNKRVLEVVGDYLVFGTEIVINIYDFGLFIALDYVFEYSLFSSGIQSKTRIQIQRTCMLHLILCHQINT